MSNQSSFYVPRVMKTHVYVVYDKETGEISHTHHVTLLDDAKAPTKRQLEDLILGSATRVGKHPRHPAFMHTGETTIKPNRIYRVDIKSKILIEEEEVVPPLMPDSNCIGTSSIQLAPVALPEKNRRKPRRS